MLELNMNMHIDTCQCKILMELIASNSCKIVIYFFILSEFSQQSIDQWYLINI